MGTINIDRGMFLFIEEIRTGMAGLQQKLCMAGQSEIAFLNESQPFSSPDPIGRDSTNVDNVRSGDGLWRGCRGTLTALQEIFFDRLPIQMPMIHLIVVTHQAVITGSFTIFFCIGCMSQVFTGLRIKVADLQCLGCYSGKCTRIIHQTS